MQPNKPIRELYYMRIVFWILLLCFNSLYASNMPESPLFKSLQTIESMPDKTFRKKVDFIASDRVKEISEYFKQEMPELSNGNSHLQLQYYRTSQTGHHYHFVQMYGQKEVYGGYIKVNLNTAGNLDIAYLHLVEIPSVDVSIVDSEKESDYYILVQKQLHPVFKDKNLLKDRNGLVIKVISDKYYFALEDTMVTGKVFNHDPLTRAGVLYGEGGTYQHFNDSDYNLLNDERISVGFPATLSNGRFRLESEFAIIKDLYFPFLGIPDSLLTPDFSFTRGQTDFKAVMAYYHVLNTRKYFHDLGFTNRLLYKQGIDPHSGTGDDSHFNLEDTTLNFGIGGIPDAEDADVITHEYTHAMSFDISPTPDMFGERRSMEEGMCDVTAAMLSYKTTIFNWRYIYNFDGANPKVTGVSGFWGGRNGQSSKTYLNKNGNPYQDCEIWTSCLLDIAEHNTVGHDTLMVLMLHSIFKMTKSTTMPQAAQILLDTDSILFDGRHRLTMGYFFNLREFGVFPQSVQTLNQMPTWLHILNTMGFAMGESAIELHNESGKPYHLMIHDLNGKEIENTLVESNRYLLSPEFFTGGLYVITIAKNGEMYKQKIIRN